MRVDPAALDQLLHPTIDPTAERKIIATGLPGPRPARPSGEIVFNSEEADVAKAAGRKVILVRVETSPDDIGGMHVAEGISHDARRHDLARRRGGARYGQAVRLGCRHRPRRLQGRRTDDGRPAPRSRRGDIITIDRPRSARSCRGAIAMLKPELSGEFATLMSLGRRGCVAWGGARQCRGRRRDAHAAREFGAQGIGLCRTEHMFFDETRIVAVREMILAEDETGTPAPRSPKLLPFQRDDFAALFEIMSGLPVCIPSASIPRCTSFCRTPTRRSPRLPPR